MLINKDKIRIIFRLVEEGKSVDEIKEIMNVSRQTVYNNIRYGVNYLNYEKPSNLTIKIDSIESKETKVDSIKK